MKKERFGKTFICNSVTLFDYIQYNHTFFTSKQISLLKKNKDRQKLYDANVGAIYECRHFGAAHEDLNKIVAK